MDFFIVYQRALEDARVLEKVVDKSEASSYNT
jgi:hypothetical protein